MAVTQTKGDHVMSAPNYVTYTILLSSIAIIAAVLASLRVAVTRAGWEEAQRSSTLRWAAVVLPLWFVVALALSSADVFRGGADRAPTIEFGIFLPVAIGLVWLWRSETASRLLDAIPQSWLVGIQFYRVLGLTFLLLNAQGSLPSLFALPAGWGDVTVGLLAPVVAVAYLRGVAGRELLVRGWNILGLLDLAVAITTGFLTSPSPLQMYAFDAPNQLISTYPLVLVPVFGVPLAVLLHVASLVKLGRETEHSRSPVGA
jgi:hypothetical protein